MRFSAISAERSIKLLIEYQCPQCGAPANIEEATRLITCDFCKVSSYLMAKGLFRYVLPSNAPESKALIYFPYFRFKGMLFSVLLSKIDHRFVDISHQAIASLHFPISLGIRSQTLRLTFETPELKGKFLSPLLPRDHMFDILENRFIGKIKQQIIHHAHIGETLSLIYAPFYLEKGRIVDAVLNKAVSEKLPENIDLNAFKSRPAQFNAQFLPTLCPHCGWDLHGEKDSLILFCHNCKKGLRPKQGGFKTIRIAHFPMDKENLLYLPFWKIRAAIQGVPLKSYADLVRLSNLPKIVRPEWEKIDFHFWGPAFKVRPQNFVSLSTSVTMGQRGNSLTKAIPDGRLHPVNLPLSESLESLKLTLASFIKPQKAVKDQLPKITIQAKKALLVYIPFEDRPHEYLEPELNIAINKNQLHLARNL